jgi:hypothetical protein
LSNAIFGKAREAWAGGSINWGTGSGGDAIHVDLIDSADYVVSISTHQFHDTTTVPTAGRVATFGPLTGKTLTLGVLDANDFTFPTVTGDQSEALLYWKNTGTPATSPLLIYVDTASSGFPVTPNSGDINVVHNASGIATL